MPGTCWEGGVTESQIFRGALWEGAGGPSLLSPSLFKLSPSGSLRSRQWASPVTVLGEGGLEPVTGQQRGKQKLVPGAGARA